MSYLDNDGQFPDRARVQVKYPLPHTPADREAWPWLPGVIVGQVDDEWHVLVDDPRVAEYDPTIGENTYPLVWRNADELRQPPAAEAAS